MNKKFFCGVSAFAMGLTSLCFVKVCNKNIDYLKNTMYFSQVSKEIDLDTKILMKNNNQNSDYNFIRLKPNKDKKIYIFIDDFVSKKTKDSIKQTINDMNNIFENISDEYNFVLCDNNKKIDKNLTTINFSYTKLPKNVHGLNNLKFDENKNKNNYCYITNSTIFLDYEIFDRLSTISQLFILKHEFLHSLGFDDIYYGYDDETSIMNVGNLGLTYNLSANDIKMLYLAYGNKHINEDNSFNKEKIDEFNAFVENYQKKYYQILFESIKSKLNFDFEKISLDEINNQEFENNGAKILVTNNTFVYNNKSYSKTGKLIVGDNFIVLPDIKIKNKNNSQFEYNDYLILLKHNNKIKCYNLEFYHKHSEKEIDEAALELDIKMR